MPTLYEPGDIVTLDRGQHHYVYELVDDSGVPFYVGVAHDPAHRFREHARLRSPKQARADAPGVARAERIALCCTPRMRIVSRHDRRLDAEMAEVTHMRSLPNLLNLSAYYPTIPTSPISEEPLF